jgi:hypothetical protein
MTDAHIEWLVLGLETNRTAQASAFSDHDRLLSVIARSEATKQSSFLVAAKLDCFASLAMTA